MNTPIIALDFNRYEEVENFLKQFDEKLYVKVGMELYMLEGRNVIKEIRAMGHDLFLDLKLALNALLVLFSLMFTFLPLYIKGCP